MTDVYFTEKARVYEELGDNLKRLLKGPVTILRSPNGKPYIDGDPLYFSIAHSGDIAVYAISPEPVGVDFEIFRGKPHPSVTSQFSERERSEIGGEEDFLRHWTAREAFIKMKGSTLADCFKRLEFYGGDVYLDGNVCGCKISFRRTQDGIAAICEQNRT